jgi:hypothetical protein
MKKNDTTQLINDLAMQAKSPSESHLWIRFYWRIWVVFAIVMALFSYALTVKFPDLAYLPTDPFNPWFVALLGLWLAMSLTLLRLAYLSAIPLSKTNGLAFGAASLFLSLIGALFVFESAAQISSGFAGELALWRGPCGMFIFASGAIVGTMVLISFKRAAPSNSGFAGLTALTSAGCLTSFFMTLICRHENGAHVLLWHAFPILVLAGLGLWAGMRILKEKF